MTLPPLEPRKNYVAHRVDELTVEDGEFYVETLRRYVTDPYGPAGFDEYLKAKATEQAEREWADRMDVLLDADINNLELHDDTTRI